MKQFVAAALLAALTSACSQQTAPTGAAADPTGVAQQATAEAAATAPQPSTESGPLDGLWRCKMNGDIPIGTLTFAGGAYTFQTTNTAWEPNPNTSDGSGTVRFEETFILPVDGPLKTKFAVTGAFGDGSFINFNTNGGLLFGCRRP